MHEAAGNQRFIVQSIAQIHDQLVNPSAEASEAISAGLGSTDTGEIEKKRTALVAYLSDAKRQAEQEPSHDDKHYVSRIDIVGIFQSALSKIFSDVPDLQGYGDWNPLWVITEIEVFAHKVKTFLEAVHKDHTGKKQSVWAAIISELIRLKTLDDRAPYPTGEPESVQLPERCTVALLADWGGDNDAAKKVAGVVTKQNPDICIHLGDIYYGGTKYECELFLGAWPKRQNWDAGSPLDAKGSWALNGNHEMYSGGEYYFDTVLPAFEQAQPFFCIENKFWRIIGLDTAYNGGRLKPANANDPLNVQWNWLVERLKGEKKANIILTHHQPVSAHSQEFNDSTGLRQDVEELLKTDGVGDDAIFGWFFGHEHRCAVYRDTSTKFNARLIGNGCIPHQVQREKAADPGCTEVDFFNKKPTAVGGDVAVSTFAKLSFMGPQLLIEYVDEDFMTWGFEVWDSTKPRLEGDPRKRFTESDGYYQ